MTDYVVTASALASYFQTHCQLHLQQRVTRNPATGAAPQAQATPTPAMQRGIRWEELLVDQLRVEGGLLKPERDLASTLSRIADSPNVNSARGLYVYHLRFQPQDWLPELAEYRIRFGACEIDFLRARRTAEGIVELTVIDAKSSGQLKLTHQVQVMFYCLALRATIASLGIADRFTIAHSGEIWRPPATSGALQPADAHARHIDSFVLEPLQQSLLVFLREKLGPLITAPDPEWHFQASCASCQYQDSCRQRAVDEGRLSVIPNLSASDYRWLRAQLPLCAAGLPEIEGLARLVRPGGALSTATELSVQLRLDRILCRQAQVGDPRRPASYDRDVGPVISAALQITRNRANGQRGDVQVIGKRTLLLPRDENVSLFLLLVMDPLACELVAWGILERRAGAADTIITRARALGVTFAAFVQTLTVEVATRLHRLSESGERAQVYVWSPNDVDTLFEILVGGATGATTASTTPEAVSSAQTCVIGLVDDAIAVLAPAQPPVAVGVAKKERNDTFEMEKRMNELQLDASDRHAMANALEEQVARATRVLSLLDAIQALVVLPVPSYYRVIDCKRFLAPTLGAVAPTAQNAENDHDELAVSGLDPSEIDSLLRQRLGTMADVLVGLRTTLRQAYTPQQLDTILLSSSSPIRLPPAASYHHSIVRRLAFVEKFELLNDWRRMRQDRLRGNTERAIVIQCTRVNPTQSAYRVLSGADLVEHIDRVPHYVPPIYSYVISPMDEEAYRGIPSYLRFSDARHHMLTTLPEPINRLGLAAIVFTDDQNGVLNIRVQIQDTAPGIDVQVGNRFVLRPRSYDVTTSRILTSLREIDGALQTEKDPPLAVRLLRKATERFTWGRSIPEPGINQQLDLVDAERKLSDLYRTRWELSGDDEANIKMLFMRPDQQKALTNTLSRCLEIVWGPPGTGKTHFLALAILRLMAATYFAAEMQNMPLPPPIRVLVLPPPIRVLVVAFTHTAIENVLERAQSLLDVTRAITYHPAAGWMKQLNIRKLDTSKTTCGNLTAWLNDPYVIMGCTVHMLAKNMTWFNRNFDMLVIDEGSQLPMSMAMIAMHQLKPRGRLLVCGDPLQLPPIRRAVYPESVTGEPALQSSVLACLLSGFSTENGMSGAANPDEFVDMLEITMRMNQPLCDFTSRLYRGRLRRAVHGNDRNPLAIDEASLRGLNLPHGIEHMVFQMHERSLVTIDMRAAAATAQRIQVVPMETMVRREALLVANIAFGLFRSARWPRAPTVDKLYIVTPHRVQRAMIRQAVVARFGRAEEDIIVDTVDRMQGKEAEAVIVCYGFLDADRVAAESTFLFNMSRINVSLSRARRLCVLLAGSAILDAQLSALWTAELQQSFAHLVAFRDQSMVVSHTIDLE